MLDSGVCSVVARISSLSHPIALSLAVSRVSSSKTFRISLKRVTSDGWLWTMVDGIRRRVL